MLLLRWEAVASAGGVDQERRENERERKTRCNATTRRRGETSGEETRGAGGGEGSLAGGAAKSMHRRGMQRAVRRAPSNAQESAAATSECSGAFYCTLRLRCHWGLGHYTRPRFFWRRLFREFLSPPPLPTPLTTSRLSVRRITSLCTCVHGVRDDGFVADVL